MAKPTPKTPGQLKAIADGIKAKRDEAERIARRNEDERLSRATVKKVAECHEAMEKAAADGKHYCEVDLPDEIRDRVAASLREYRPTFNGDGYGHNCICFRWD